jgi:hypothetical protein
MNREQRLNLDKMIQENDAQDNTERIRKLKHSKKIKEDVEIYLNLKDKYQRMKTTNFKLYKNILEQKCSFLWSNYTNLFNRLIKDELNLQILSAFINTLKEIEDGNLDQHEASYKIGEVLKKMYIDSAITRQEKIDNKLAKSEKKKEKSFKKISWKQFKERNNTNKSN